jgi:hypothetical protein
MRRWPAVLFVGAVLVAAAADAAEWGGIAPGVSNMNNLRTLYGAPSRTATQKVEAYDGQQWVYEGPRAPAGIQRMVVDFGLLARGAFRPDLVRAVTLEPKPGIFNVDLILQGWGVPQRESPPGQPIAFFYESGLLVYFADDGRAVTSMIFTPPQAATTPAAGSAAPRR